MSALHDEPAAVLADPVDETRRILRAAETASFPLRAIGGIGIALRAPSIGTLRPTRTYHDIDLVGPAGRQAIERRLEGLGHEGARRFNTLNGSERHERQVVSRLPVDCWTLPLADLVLTTLQIVELTDCDMLDLSALFADHDRDPTGDAGISVPRLAEVCASDWGW